MAATPDVDPQETQEWLDALEAVLELEGAERAHFLLEQMIDTARRNGVNLPYSPNTAYVNTIPVPQEERFPGDLALERRIRALIRWNAHGHGGARQQGRAPSWAATSPASPRRRRSTTSASTISSAPPTTTTAATWCTSRAIRRPASTPAPFSKGA